MASYLKQFRFAWKELDEALNKIADAINFNAPLEGTGIHLDELGGHGISINRADQGDSGGGGSSQQKTAPPQVVWHGVAWKNVDVMDANCNRSTITVLVSTGNAGDSITIT